MTSVRRNGLTPLRGDMVFLTYARVSSDDQEKDGMSLPVQDKETLTYGADRPNWVLGGRFVDVETGSNPMRRDYQRMKGLARSLRAEGKPVAIIVVKQSRFGRDIEELARARRELVKELGIEIHSTRDGGHIKDELSFLFRGVMNHNELTVISEGVSKSFARIREHGWLKPGAPRWGYRWEPSTAEQRGHGAPMVVPVPHETEAEYVRELFRRRAAGASYRALSAWVHSLPSTARGGRQLGVSSVRDAINAPAYVGRNGSAGPDVLDRPAGRWEPLCDEATWRQIHRANDGRENVVPLATPRQEYPLTHYLFCECGARMCGQLRGGNFRIRAGRRPYREPVKRVYVCVSRMEGATARAERDGRICNRTITADLIERQIFETFAPLVGILASPGMRELARRTARELDRRASSNGPARRLLQSEQDRERLGKERSGLTRSLASGAITQDAYDEAYAAITVEVDAADAEIARLAAAVATTKRRDADRPVVEIILDQADFWERALTVGTIDDKREFLRLVLDHATPKRLQPGQYQAGMRLTSLGHMLLELASSLLGSSGRIETVRQAWANCSTSTRPAMTEPLLAVAHSG